MGDRLKELSRSFVASPIESRKIDEKNLIITHIINTKALDRYNTIILPRGAQVKNFLKNPVVLWLHNIGKENDTLKIPIARCLELQVDDEKIIAKTKFNGNSEFALNVFKAYKDGFLHAWSIGFRPIHFDKYTIENRKKLNETYGVKVTEKQIEDAGIWGVYLCDKWELLEYSAVPVPGNPEALNKSVDDFQKQLSIRGLIPNMEIRKSDFELKFEKVEKEEDITLELALDYYYASDEDKAKIGEDRAKWTKKFINNLPDSAFAVIEPDYPEKTKDKNARHLPHHNGEGDLGKAKSNANIDKPHLRNALARANQIKPITDSISVEDLRSKAQAHLNRHKDALEEKKNLDLIDPILTDEELASKDNKSVDAITGKEFYVADAPTELEKERGISDEHKETSEKTESVSVNKNHEVDDRIKQLSDSVLELRQILTSLAEATKKSTEDLTKKVKEIKQSIDIDNIDKLRELENKSGKESGDGSSVDFFNIILKALYKKRA